jgi:hypothetical protein
VTGDTYLDLAETPTPGDVVRAVVIASWHVRVGGLQFEKVEDCRRVDRFGCLKPHYERKYTYSC